MPDDPREECWVAIPAYNNRETVASVAAACREIVQNVVVVDDGSTDCDVSELVAGLGVTVLKHNRNQGKGAAIQTASRFVEERGGKYMITIDADGQHAPEDIRKFLPAIAEEENAIVVGVRDFETPNVPKSSRFGRKFANFWFRVETGMTLSDCQSGFRAYPAGLLNRLPLRGSHYDLEAEVLARAAWAGLNFREVLVSVKYPRPEERVSSFRPFLDNLRLTHTHALLALRRLLPVPHRRIAGEKKKLDWGLILRPREFFSALARENATPEGLALAAGVGTFIAAVPMPFHTGVILYAAARLRLNKLMALNIQHLCMPPFVPALCIEVGHYLRTGSWFTDLTVDAVFRQFSDRLWEWFLGSLVVAPAGAVAIGALIYGITAVIMKGRVRAWLLKRLPSREGIG